LPSGWRNSYRLQGKKNEIGEKNAIPVIMEVAKSGTDANDQDRPREKGRTPRNPKGRKSWVVTYY